MRETILLLAGCAVLLTGCGGDKAESGRPSAPIETGIVTETAAKLTVEQIAQALTDGHFEEVYGQTSADFQMEITIAQFLEGISGFGGANGEWKLHSRLSLNGVTYASLIDPDGKKGVIVYLDSERVITGLLLKPLEKFPDTDESMTKLSYRAPFQGEWNVTWGGQDTLSNYHYEVPSQRYAYDLVQIKDGFSYQGDAAKNESYYAFGQDVFAPQAGTVVQVVNDIPDNEPVGTMNEEKPAGNVVVIDHGGGEFSYLAHLMNGSAKVKVGDSVKQGDLIGLCGNSGNSSEPHLHYQVSDGPDLFAGRSIRIQWEGGLRPIQGESISGQH